MARETQANGTPPNEAVANEAVARGQHSQQTERKPRGLRTLLIDNYDSYTYNLFQLMASTFGTVPDVLPNDAPDLAGIDLGQFDAVVISPGPGRPDVSRDVGGTLDLLAASDLPVLGVCLGHQALARLAGARVAPAPVPRHGYVERVRHDGSELFRGMPQPFDAVRYHSLCVATPLPETLEAIATGQDWVVMALRHRQRPWWGVQFHPESVASAHGRTLLANFGRLAAAAPRRQPALRGRPAAAATRRGGRSSMPPRTTPGTDANAVDGPGTPWFLHVRELDRDIDTERAFAALFADLSYAFWLDSSRVESGLSRFSFLGCPEGAYGEVLSYRVGNPAVECRSPGGDVDAVAGSIFDVLTERLRRRRIQHPTDLPFDVAGGYVGAFGYELKADCGGAAVHTSPHPDAVWMSASRVVAVDHLAERSWVIGLCHRNAHVDGACGVSHWVDETHDRLSQQSLPATESRPPPGADVDQETHPGQWLDKSRAEYLARIAECQQQLRAGESYEICLTNQLTIPFDGSTLDYYRRLRRRNPAPYSAYFQLDGVVLASSSPERFLSVDRDRTVEAKPIKGTARRDQDPTRDNDLRDNLGADAKTRAENLMIVDLLRNDLGRVCEIGSVRVDRLMHVESYATVHQLVSTIRGRLVPGITAVDAAHACFPGGSMTGAPKLRTMEILDGLEQRPRGFYSGAIGYFGPSGTADLSIVIRTAVIDDGRITIGTGGAIVLDSDADEEIEEILLKARPLLAALFV